MTFVWGVWDTLERVYLSYHRTWTGATKYINNSGLDGLEVRKIVLDE